MTLTAPDRASLAPLPYHRLGRGRWRPLAVVVTTVALYLALVLVVAVPAVLLQLAVPDLAAPLDRAMDGTDMSDPLVLGAGMVMIAGLLPAALLAVRLVGGRPVGTLSSVAGRLRWGLLGRCLRLALLIIVPVFAASALLAGDWRDAELTARTLPLLAVALLVVPLQAAAEEYVFRGVLAQAIGAWLRHPAFAIVLPVPLFAIGHEYDVLGLADIAVFALVAGWLTWRTGGLEAAIGLHVASNAVVIGAGGLGLADLNATEGSLVGLACSVGTQALYAWRVLSLLPRP